MQTLGTAEETRWGMLLQGPRAGGSFAQPSSMGKLDPAVQRMGARKAICKALLTLPAALPAPRGVRGCVSVLEQGTRLLWPVGALGWDFAANPKARG